MPVYDSACTDADIQLSQSRVAGKQKFKPKLNQPRFRNVSVITLWNVYRDQINKMGCKQFVTEHGQTLSTFYSIFPLLIHYYFPSSFDAWTFVDGTDTNFGNVLYATRGVAMSQGLAFFNGAGNAIIKLDNVTDGRGNNQFGRNSVKLLSNNTVSPGSLIIADMVHMPFGVSLIYCYL